MSLVRRINWWYVYFCLMVLIGVLVGMAACNGIPPSKTEADIGQARTAVSQQATTLGQLGTTVDGLTPSNLPTEKGKATVLVGTAKTQNGEISTALGSAAKGAHQDTVTIASSKNTVVERLNWIGASVLIAGIAALVASVFFSTYLGSFAAIAGEGGGAAIVVGLSVLAIAYWLHDIMVILGCLGAAGALGVGVYVYLHRADILPEVNWLLNKVKTTTAATVAAVKKDVA